MAFIEINNSSYFDLYGHYTKRFFTLKKAL
jgi:hypothetical protein